MQGSGFRSTVIIRYSTAYHICAHTCVIVIVSLTAPVRVRVLRNASMMSRHYYCAYPKGRRFDDSQTLNLLNRCLVYSAFNHLCASVLPAMLLSR